MEDIKIKFNVGDKVITYDGIQGRIVDICHCQHCKDKGFFEPIIEFENGQRTSITLSDVKNGCMAYYLIGKQVLGNKIEKEELQKQLAELEDRKKLLRKQIWRLDNVMVEDWKERREQRKDREEETAEQRMERVLEHINTAIEMLPDNGKKEALKSAIETYLTDNSKLS